MAKIVLCLLKLPSPLPERSVLDGELTDRDGTAGLAKYSILMCVVDGGKSDEDKDRGHYPYQAASHSIH